jgi:hypothetical protein
LEIANVLNPRNSRVNLKLFTRVTPANYERHLVLEAPNAVARRALFDALRATRS